MNWFLIDKIIESSFIEDIPNSDITSESIIPQSQNCTIDLIAKENGIVSGLLVFKRVFDLLGNVNVNLNYSDGDAINKGDILATLNGSTLNILKGERTALNILQRMSGISTITNKYVKLIEDTKASIVDTRKTMPGIRILDKYAVTIGGGKNHRTNLSDGILIKDNHIAAAGGISNAIKLARKNSSFVRKIEVEVETIEEVIEALDSTADIIMLDNMNIDILKEAVKLIGNKAIIEASGNVDLGTVRSIALSGVHIISVGALTHSVKALDISLKNLVFL